MSEEREREEQTRLNEIRRGPWMIYGETARKSLATSSDMRSLLEKDHISPQDFQFALNRRDRRRVRELAHRFEPHWQGEEFTEPEYAFRESFDEALTVLQLLELAVETGYLTLEAVRPAARSELVALLWAPPARQFLDTYDYWTVRYIAERVGVDLGLPKLVPPRPDPAGEAEFGAFLALVSEWAVDPDLDAWLGLLDGHMLQDPDDKYYVEADAFYEFLTTGELPDEADLDDVLRYFSLARGAFKFIFQLYGTVGPMQKRERFFFLTFFAYELSKFFGYELGDRGYVRTGEEWDAIGGASAFHRLLSDDVFSSGAEPDTRTPKEIGSTSNAYASSVSLAVSTLRELWHETRIRLAKTRSRRHRSVAKR